ncbi:CHRD domain-containing protein [Chitinophaga sp. 212800010-3]|uniref:CHRD domain-containing protein n=1 Tax=unclassified Chitinophaga TaxID=2619133 RepID=UPI002DE89818|nr:CHRD domain-containing protein [Chitinophaga sp. 212800010-3]
MNTMPFFRLYRKQLLAYSLMGLTVLSAACSKSNGYGGGNPPPGGSNTYTISATLNGASEVPANSTTGTGSLTGSYDPSTYKLTFTLTWNGLTGAPTGMHFHGPAMAGATAAVVLPITGFPAAASGSVSATAVLTAAQAGDLLSGKWYVNIHTVANGNGEIRGQVSATMPSGSGGGNPYP